MAKTIYNGKEVETEDVTPTWRGILPLLLETVHLKGTKIELEKMAQLADERNEIIKVMSTAYPETPPKDFNEWMNYINSQLSKK